MITTHESSSPYQSALDRTVPSQWQPQLRADLNELQMYRAQQPITQDQDKVTAKKERAVHAGLVKNQRKRAAIDVVIESHKPQVVSWTGSRRSRAEWLKRLIGATAPGWRYIDDYLKTLHF